MTRPRRSSRPAASSMSAEEKVGVAQNALVNHRAADPVMLDMREVTLITDYFLICHGTSNVHIRSLADAVMEAFEEQGVEAFGVEGHREARWVLLDYGDLVVHIFSAEDREFYDLERLWSDAPRVSVSSLDQSHHV